MKLFSFKQTHFFLAAAFTSAVVLSGCGGGGDSAPDTTAPTLVSASTDSTGVKVNLTYNEVLNTSTAPNGALSVIVNGSAKSISSTSTDGTNFVITLASPIVNGQTVAVTYTAPSADSSTTNPAIQDISGNDATSLTAQAVTNNVGSGPSVLNISINGGTATINSNGEYALAAGSRVTITAASGLSSYSASTKDASNNSASTSMSIHTLSSTTYDVTFSSAPSGGLTTITFATLGQTVKLRWL